MNEKNAPVMKNHARRMHIRRDRRDGANSIQTIKESIKEKAAPAGER
jgi:hypothetical protein